MASASGTSRRSRDTTHVALARLMLTGKDSVMLALSCGWMTFVAWASTVRVRACHITVPRALAAVARAGTSILPIVFAPATCQCLLK